jgi:hypothetical protein
MNIGEDFELLESLFVELDPLEDGFGGVLLEVHRQGDRYVLVEVAPLPATDSSGSPPRTGNWSTQPLLANWAVTYGEERAGVLFPPQPLPRGGRKRAGAPTDGTTATPVPF